MVHNTLLIHWDMKAIIKTENSLLTDGVNILCKVRQIEKGIGKENKQLYNDLFKKIERLEDTDAE